jgi:AbrB family looped-hinge helix DNA binding protein
MAKVTSKLQLTVPKAIASQYGIRPGDRVELIPGGEIIRMIPGRRRLKPMGAQERLRIFDGIMKRADERAAKHNGKPAQRSPSRGWTREDLYDGRGLSR